MVAVHGAQPFGADRVQGMGDSPVVEVRGRLGRGQSEVHGDGVALVRPDAVAVHAEAPFVVGRDDMVELAAGEGESLPGRRPQEIVDPDPALGVERDADALRLVPEVARKVFGHLDGASFIHPVRVPKAHVPAHPISSPSSPSDLSGSKGGAQV